MRAKTFKTNISIESYIWISIVLISTALIRYESISKGDYLSTIINVSLLAVFWYFVFFYSKYLIAESMLLCKTISVEKGININSITKIEKGNSIWKSGLFFVWYPYQKGLNIYYGNQEDVFVNPDDQENFIKELLEINPKIELMK